jgi:thioesterase domain-containing protein
MLKTSAGSDQPDATRSALPKLIAIRGWSADIDPAYLSFVDEMRATGCEVVDIFVSHDGFATFGEWADASIESALAHHIDGEPLHLLGYCGGGTLLAEGMRTIERSGLRPSYVGFIDVRAGHPKIRLQRGFDSIYAVPWAQRIRHQLVRLTPPDRESFFAVASSVLRRAVKSTIDFPKRGWRSRNLRIPIIHRQAELAARWEFNSIITPAYLYNCMHSIESYWPGDPSLGRAGLLKGGFSVCIIEGDHHSCLQSPNSAGLIAQIMIDRQKVHSAKSMLNPKV